MKSLGWSPSRATSDPGTLAANGVWRGGACVAVRFTGPVAESDPVQATAADVEVLSGP